MGESREGAFPIWQRVWYASGGRNKPPQGGRKQGVCLFEIITR